MIKYICDGCGLDLKANEIGKNVIEGQDFCNKCKAKVNTIVGDLTGQKNIKKADVDTWYRVRE